MSTASPPPLPALPPVPQLQLQHHQHYHRDQRQLQEQLEQQSRHFQRLAQYRQQPILPTHSNSYVYHSHPYFHPHRPHHYVHSPQQQQQQASSSSPSSLLPSLSIEPQALSPTGSFPQGTAIYPPIPSWQQPLSPIQQHYPHSPHQHLRLHSPASLDQSQASFSPSPSLSPTQSNLQQFLFAENSVPFEGFSVSPEHSWDPLSGGGSNLFASSASPDLFTASLYSSGYYLNTPNPSTVTEDEVTAAGSNPHVVTLSSFSSKEAVPRYKRRSFKIRVDKRVDMYREPEKDDTDQFDNNSNSNNGQTIMPLHPSEWCESSSPAPPLSPLGMVDTNGFQSTLVQSLANLTTSSPNLACLSPPTFSSAFTQNPSTFSDNQKPLPISSDHLSRMYTKGNKDDLDNNNNNNGDNSKAAANDDESDRRFQCPVCPKRFLRQYNLNAHLKTHSQVRAHACTQCDKIFLRPYDLARHHRIHSNSKPYTCNICQLIFIRNDAIWRHYRRAHPGHPDVPPARRQRRPQQCISVSPGATTAVSNNSKNTSFLHSSLTSPTCSTSAKSTASPKFGPHDPTSSSSSSTDNIPSPSYSSPSASVTFASIELPLLN